jgi:hypothetical protein
MINFSLPKGGTLNRLPFVLALVATAPTFAVAQSLADISQFAQSICGDIPEGQLSRTSVQGKVGANAGLLAKIVSGNAEVSGSKAEEVYHGIPFEKLPDKIPTVSLCKTQLVNVLLSARGNQSLTAPFGINQTGPNSQATVINNNK